MMSYDVYQFLIYLYSFEKLKKQVVHFTKSKNSLNEEHRKKVLHNY